MAIMYNGIVIFDATMAAIPGLSFEHPLWLAVGAAAVLPAVVARLAMARGRRAGKVAVIAQTLAIVLAAMALAGPSVRGGPKADMPYMILHDVSGSTRGQQTPLEWPQELPREDWLFAMSVAKSVGPLTLAPNAQDQATRPAFGQGSPDQNATELGQALRMALAHGDQIAGLVIRTDGQFTDTDWPAAASAIGAAGLKVFVVPMISPPADGRVAEFSASREADDKVHLHLTVASNCRQRRQVTVTRLGSEPAVLLDRVVEFLPDEPSSMNLIDPAATRGAQLYRVQLSPADAFSENDVALAAVPALVKHVAVVGKLPKAWFDAVRHESIELTELTPPQAPTDSLGWLPYSAVILTDWDGHVLSPAQRNALAQYVRGGGGLVLVGAGPGASIDDASDPLNQVAALVPQTMQRKPLDLTLVLDASGSMGERQSPQSPQPKFDLVRQAVLNLQRYLTGHDRLAVVTFSDRPVLIYDSGAGEIDAQKLLKALGEVKPSGPTNIWPAIKMVLPQPAASAAAKPKANRDKLVIVASDLRTPPFEVGVDQVAQMFKDAGVHLRVLATEEDSATPPKPWPLEELAEKLSQANLSGPVVKGKKLTELAEVFADLVTQARGPAIKTGDFAVDAPGAVFGVELSQAPHPNAHLVCGPQSNTQILARIAAMPLSPDAGQPLLARRQVGLGQSVGLAIPIDRQYNEGWLKWPGAAKLILGAAMSAGVGDDHRFIASVSPTKDGLHVVVQGADQNGPINLRELVLQCQMWDEATPRQTPLRQTAPGRYEAFVPPSGQTVTLAALDVTGLDASKGVTLWRQVVPEHYSQEYVTIGGDWESLRKLATLTGGQVVVERDLQSLQRRLVQQSQLPLWPILLAAALAVMLAEWAIARVLRE